MIYSFEKIFNRSQINFNVSNKIFKNKRILITGAKGLIGRVLYAILKKSGAEIYALDIELDIIKSKNIKKFNSKQLESNYIKMIQTSANHAYRYN